MPENESKSAGEAGPRRGRTHDAEGTREAILNAAEQVFAQHGFDGARIDAIAAAAGYNKSLIFQYYGDKLGLYDEVIRRADRQMSGLQTQVLASFSQADLLAQPEKVRSLFASFIKGFFEFLLENPRFGQILLWEMAEGWQTYRKIISQHDFDDMQQFMPILDKLQAAGLVRSDPDPFAQILIAEMLCPLYLGVLPLMSIFMPDRPFSEAPALARAGDFLAELITAGIVLDPGFEGRLGNRFGMFRRLKALIRKEFIQLLRDRRTLILIMFVPSLELILFAAAIHTDLKHIPMVVADQSLSPESRAYLNAFTAGQAFDIRAVVASQAEAVQRIDRGQASLGLVIPPDFALQAARRNAQVLMLVDGSSSYTAQSAYNTANAISQSYAIRLGRQALSPLDAHIQILYNPDLKDLWFITPGFIAMLVMSGGLGLTALAIVREREVGTIEALLVTPVRPFELVLAKTLPNLCVVTGLTFMCLLTSRAVLGVPFRGSLLLFFGLSLLNAFCGLGLGLAISTLAQTQAQAQQLAALLNISSMFLGGVLFPAYALPWLLRGLSALFPSSYFIPITRALLIKGAGLADFWPQALALLVLLAAILLAAPRLFRQSLD